MKKIVLFVALVMFVFMPASFGRISPEINTKNIINSTGTSAVSMIDVNCTEAIVLLKDEEYRKAYDLADKISKLKPTYYLPYQIKAIASANMYNFQDALDNIDKAIKLRPDVVYPIKLYEIRESILYDLAYLDGEKPNLKYAEEFKKDFDLILEKYYYQIYPSEVDYSKQGYTLSDYIDDLVFHIAGSGSYSLYKINTLLAMASSEELKKCKYSNSYMYYFKLYALAIKIALEVSNQDFKQTKTTRKKVLSMIKNKTSQKGDKYHDDFTKYLYYKLSGDGQKAEDWIHKMVVKRDEYDAYPKGYLYEDDIDDILDYVKRYEYLIWDNQIW